MRCWLPLLIALAAYQTAEHASAQGVSQPRSIQPTRAASTGSQFYQTSMSSTNRQSSTAATPISFDCSSDACAPSYGATCGSGCACNDCCGGSILGECCLGEKFDLGEQLFCPDSGWDLGGWTQIGYHSSNDGVFNTHPGNLDLQQGYMFLEKIADGKRGVGFGGRVDVMYGTDASNTQAFGNNPGNFDFQNGFDHGIYGWALPQMYGEVAYENLSVKLGHFYTLMGYQVVPATGNFFYSIPYTFNFSEAFTHTGALATYKAHDNLTLYGGWTLGWDTGFDQVNQGNSFLGGASFKATDNVTATYICTAGNLGWIGNGYAHSIVIDWVVNDKWEYVLQSDLNSIDNSVNAQGGHYDTIGLNQYLFYTVNDCLKVGGRNEWWKADGVSFYESAFGLNIRPRANLLLRPELRYNWQPGTAVPGVLPVASTLNRTTIDDYRDNAIFGMDAIFSF